MIWKILGIEETKDEEMIRAAYRSKLRFVNPEDDEEGFKELRRAYEKALDYANQEETNDLHNIDNERPISVGRKTEVDLWIDRIDVIYQDVRSRRDEKKWNEILYDSVCDDLDTELEAGEKLLVYLMSHSYLPQAIWKLIDKRFGYMAEVDQLKERFPENFLEYIRWQIKSQGFIDYDLFDGKTDSHVDDYINKLYEVKTVSEEKDVKKIRHLLDELSRFDITHPFTRVEEARYLLLLHEQEGGEHAKEALSIMEELDFEYSDNLYIERIYAEALIANGEISKAKTVYESILEISIDNFNAMLGLANCTFLLGDAEAAKEKIEDILEERVQDAESLELLEKINEKLVQDYEASLREKADRETCFKLGWCYYQQKRFDEGIVLLDQLGESEEYDYINLRCRLYLASEDYDKAYPLARKWTAMIEKCEDDGSKETQKKKNRLSLAHFSIGVCIWESEYKKAAADKKTALFTEAVENIQKAAAEENNLLVKLSYLEQLARFYLEDKRYEECITVCDKIIDKDNGFFPAYVHRQKANYELRNAKEVLDDFYECIDLYPEYVPPYILATEVFMAFEQYEDVEKVLKAAKSAGLESDSLELVRIKCMHYKEFSEENVKKALKALEILRENVKKENTPTDLEDVAELEKEYAILYWDLNQTKKTMEIIEEYLKDHPQNLTMLHLKVDVLNREKQYEEALKVCRNLLHLEPNNLYTRTKLGGCYERLENQSAAIECYQEILKENPNYIPALRRMMYIYSYLSNKEDDREKCKKGIYYASRLIDVTESAEGYIERGNLYIDLYELELAVEDCKKAIELDPEAYYAYNNLGCALLKLRRVKEAVIPLEQAIAMESDRDHLPYLNLAECYVLLKEYDKALNAYREVLRMRPKAHNIKKEIVKVYVLKKEYKKAIAILQKQVDEIKKKVSNLQIGEKIEFYIGKGMTDEKEKLLMLFWEIAEIYRKAGEYQKAEQYYKKAETGPVPFAQYFSCGVLKRLAEHYRDMGNLKLAEKLICKALGTKDEKQKGNDKYRDLYFTYATILFEQGNQKKAADYAMRFIKDLFEREGGEEQLLTDERYRQMHLFDLAIMYLCAGELEKAKEYLAEMKKCKLCVICETWNCFEYYFGMGLVEEKNENWEEAKKWYQKALEIKEDYLCAKRHLELLH